MWDITASGHALDRFGMEATEKCGGFRVIQERFWLNLVVVI
jgi:hypothetical protein